jgi:hypothetical protein
LRGDEHRFIDHGRGAATRRTFFWIRWCPIVIPYPRSRCNLAVGCNTVNALPCTTNFSVGNCI